MRRNLTPILWVGLLGILPAALYGWYFLGQMQRIAAFHQRELARAAENLRTTLNGSAINIRNVRSKPSFTCEFLQRQIYLAMPPGKNCTDYEDPRNAPPQAQAQVTVKVANEAITICAGGDDFCFRVALDKVLDELVVSDGFEYLFVATGTGEVFFQTRRGERQRWMENLRWVNRHLRDGAIATVMPVRFRNIDTIGGRPDGKPPAPVSKENTASLPVEIAGERYRMYLQPVPHMESQEGGIIVGGLVSMRANMTAALAVEPRFALALAFLAGLGLLAWPLVKIVVLAPGERFSFADSVLLLLSGAALLGVSTVALLGADNARRAGTFGTERLEQLANRLAEGLVRELSDAGRQLSAYDSDLAAAFQGEACAAEGQEVLWEQTRLLLPQSGAPQTRTPSTGDRFGWLRLPAPQIYKSPIAVFWARASGWQFAKTATGSKNTPPVSVRERLYFLAARHRHLWTVEPGSWFYTQVYRSITTGDFETGIAIPSQTECSGARNNVAVLTTPTLNSLSPKALPPDYGFLLIDRSGRVLYHSDPRRALREDLFEEVGDPARLRAIVMSEQPVHFTATYGSGLHDFYIRPMKEIRDSAAGFNGWYIVTFRELQLVRTQSMEAGISALVWFGLYFLLVQFVPALVMILRGRGHSGWIWPDREKLGLYRRVAAEMAILTAAAITAIAVADGWWLVACSYLTGAFAMALGFWEYRRWRSGRQDSRTSRLLGGAGFRASRTVCVALLFLPISILPAAGLFKFAWNDEARRLLAYEDKYIAERASDLRWEIEDRAAQQFAAAYPPPNDLGALVKEYLGAQQAVVIFEPGAERPVGAPDPLADWKKVYNDASAALRYQIARQDLISGDWNFSMRPGLCTLAGGFVLMAGLLTWILYWDKRLLLSEAGPTSKDGKTGAEAAWREGQSAPDFRSLWESCTDAEKLALVHVEEEGFANPKQPQIAERLLRKGLLVKNPGLEPFHPDFGQFIHEVHDRSQVAAWEQPSNGMGWSQSRWVLSLLLVTLGVFLLATQREALNPVVTFIPTLGGAVSALIKLIGDLSPKQRPAGG